MYASRLRDNSGSEEYQNSIIGLTDQSAYSHESSTSVQFSSVTQSCLILCDPMNCSTSGLPVHHQLPEFTQTHVHWVGDAINHLILCHPLLLLPQSFPPSGSFQMSQLFASGGQSIGVPASTSALDIFIMTVSSLSKEILSF